MAKTGDHHYQAFVGPAHEYDIMGATQFALLYSLGLRARHRLLDIGCGSLRAGRLLIPYLDSQGYTGLDPNQWLIDQGIEMNIGRDLVEAKQPTFVYNDSFDVSDLPPFDFIVAQSVASHTGPAMTRQLMASVHQALSPKGMAVVTFIHTGGAETSDEGWVYPQCVRYRRATIGGWLGEAGLKGTPIAWHHPRQTWWVIVHAGRPLPPRGFRIQNRGVTLSRETSWNLVTEAKRRLSRMRAGQGVRDSD